jgi:hypothetical protein
VSFKSDLRLPDSVYQALTIYLLLAIGIKGGVSLSEVGFAVVAIPLAGTLFIGITLPVLAKDYFPHYAVSCWSADVEVIREDRY